MVYGGLLPVPLQLLRGTRVNGKHPVVRRSVQQFVAGIGKTFQQGGILRPAGDGLRMKRRGKTTAAAFKDLRHFLPVFRGLISLKAEADSPLHRLLLLRRGAASCGQQEQAETHFPHPIHSATFPPPRSRNRSRDFCYNKQPFRKCKPETGQSSIFL